MQLAPFLHLTMFDTFTLAFKIIQNISAVIVCNCTILYIALHNLLPPHFLMTVQYSALDRRLIDCI